MVSITVEVLIILQLVIASWAERKLAVHKTHRGPQMFTPKEGADAKTTSQLATTLTLTEE